MLSTGLVVVHDSMLGGQDAESILSGRQNLVHLGVHVSQLQIEARRDCTTLVDATCQLDDYLVRTLVMNDFNVIHISTRLGRLKTTRRRRETYPCFCITLRNRMTTVDTGRKRTCLLPALSALMILVRQSDNTPILTIFSIERLATKGWQSDPGPSEAYAKSSCSGPVMATTGKRPTLWI